jgi:hypothetical protein
MAQIRIHGQTKIRPTSICDGKSDCLRLRSKPTSINCSWRRSPTNSKPHRVSIGWVMYRPHDIAPTTTSI